MSSSGKAMMGTGEAEGDNRAMAATELALNNPLIDEYTLQGAKGLLVNITGGSDIKLFEVDAAVNKIRAEVDPEAELIFGAIKDENMNGKIRVSIVATSLKGTTVSPDPRPKLNVVNGSSRRNDGVSDNLFTQSNIDQNIVSSIDGATALKLDENYEIKNSEEQNMLMDSFESNEENEIAAETSSNLNSKDEIPSGVSIESASYIENNKEIKDENIVYTKNTHLHEKNDLEEYTPKLFSDETSTEISKTDIADENSEEELFQKEVTEEDDFEIPAFLRRQKF